MEHREEIVYKFKSLEPFENVVDLLVNERAYCPTPEQLNDPLEGMLGVKGPGQAPHSSDEDQLAHLFDYWERQRIELNTNRVCSFSRGFDSPLMWSYYGNGHSGMCVELDITPYANDIINVRYVEDLAEVDHSSASSRLHYKLKFWEHEQEVRVVVPPDNSGQYLRIKIVRVLVGTRLAEKYIKPLIELCRLKVIVVNIVAFDTSGKATCVGWNLSGSKPVLEAKP